MPLRARRDAGKAGPRSLSRRALALISLLWPLRSSAFLLNLTFAPRHAILRSCCSQRSSIVGVAAGSWARPTRQLRRSTGRYPGASAAEAAAGERLRPVTVTAAAAKAGDDSGYTAKSEKVYRVDDILVRESDIDACRAFDECDISPETLGKPFGGGGGDASRGGGGGGGDGDGYDRSRFHVHFGAGRLGLGLVVGAIAQSKTPFGVVQRPKASWGGIISHGCGAQIELTVNGKPIVSDVTVISEGCDVEEYLKVGRAAMVVVGDRPTLLQLVRKATSFSCSLGAAMTIAMIPLLSELEDKPFEERPVLYACENDHDAVRRVGEMVTSKVTTVPCMVDRICTGRQIGEYEVNVEAEPNFGGSLVLLDPPSDPSLVPFAGTTVLIPSTREEASYFYKRKFSVVNGMHTVLGFMTLREKAPGAKELREHDLLAYDTASPEIRAELWAWVVVRCLALLDEFGVDMLKSAHDLETEEEVFDVLLDYGGQALDRFSSVVDSTSRVLGGGLGNRLTTRLQPMVVFMKNNTMKGSGLPGERFLERAGVEEVFAREAIKSLARSSVSFCTQDFMAAKKARVEARALKAAKVEENKATRVVPDAKAQSGKASSGKQEPSVAQG